jgi:hypothetical protein
MDAATFFHLLFDDAAGPDALISIWTLPDKRTRWFEDCNEAAKYIAYRNDPAPGVGPLAIPNDLALRPNIYFGCCLYQPDITSGRGKASDVVGLVGLWADIDFGPNHKGKNIPPDLDTATHIIERLGVPPSIVVHSGHGLQPWWLFKEFLPVPMPPEDAVTLKLHIADDPVRLSERWGATIKAVAHANGYTVDSVHDLARVLRPPGTMNRKAKPVQVTAVASDPLLRYEPDYLESMCVEMTVQGALLRSTDSAPSSGTLDLRPGRQLTVNLAQVERMTAVDTRFKATWNGKRRDLPDGSASSYDMALAHFGVLLEWSDQRIADLIYLWRIMYSRDPQKAARRKYIEDTIHKARQRRDEEQAVEEITEPSQSQSPPPAGAKSDNPTDPSRADILARLQKVLRVPIARWVQYGAADADYTLILDDGRAIVIGPVEAVTSPTRFRNAVYQTVGILPPRVKNSTWDGVCRYLAIIRETIENPEESREAEAVEWVTAYLAAGEGRHICTEGLDIAIEKKALLRRAGRLHIRLDGVWKYLAATAGYGNLTKQTVRKALQAAGFVSTVVTPTNRNIKAQRYWRDDKGHFAISQAGDGKTYAPTEVE